ncbi:hypothetical protein KDA_65710 [Dictyobacter alpinus]|uniref:LppX_LprAFG lipoprotein n=1 Tax=Dictyobacter alpinus TaxID=2014873 RepID=A0A402BIK6_9CHLR|nr:DUF6612 family protein [Dictyobacter alpinus]GCE31087.1 hypothetical protein KDA_65710 [Dictyobacter alpinus]
MKKVSGIMMLLGVWILAVFFSGCSTDLGASNNGKQTQPSTPRSSYTLQQVVQKSSDAMKNLKSAHIELASESNNQLSSGKSVSTIKGSGDQMQPDQQQLSLTLNSFEQTIPITEIIKGDKVYIQNPEKKWFVTSTKTYTSMGANPFAGVTFDPQDLLLALSHITIQDHDLEAVNGQNMRHITATLDKEALKQILTGSSQLQQIQGQQYILALLNSANNFQSSIDIWIDETNFYIHRGQLKIHLQTGTNTSTPTNTDTTPPIPGTNATITAMDLNTTLDWSKFNEPVTITTPADATPVDNPETIFNTARP